MDGNRSGRVDLENQFKSNTEFPIHPYADTDQIVKDLTRRIEAIEKLQDHKTTCTIKEDTSVKHNNRINVGFREKIRRKPTKSSSFSDRSSSKTRHRSPHRHTVPSDRDESLRIEEFRNECLSKAIKCNTVDIITSYIKRNTAATFLLPSWLSVKEKATIRMKRDVKYQVRTFLSLLREKDFHTARAWVEEESGLERVIIDHVWKTYQEFNDVELIMNRMCTFCVMKLKVDVADIIDHFFSLEIIKDELYHEINSSDYKTGSQESLWLKVAKECTDYPVPSYVQEALRYAIMDVVETTDKIKDKEVLNRILKDLVKDCEEMQNIFVCRCKEICSKVLQPLSLLKSISVLNIYSSPPSKRRVNKQMEGLNKDDARPDVANYNSVSSNESIASHLKMKHLKSVEDDTYMNDNDNMTLETMDDRYKSISNTDQRRMNKRRQRKSQGKKTKDIEQTYRKTVEDISHDTGIADTLDTNEYTDGTILKTSTEKQTEHTASNSGSYRDPKHTASNSGLYRDRRGDIDSSFSSDSLSSSTDLRAKTQKLFEQQQNLKETTKSTSFNITAARVYIKSTHISQSRYSSIDSAST